jgi:hypothetical protein
MKPCWIEHADRMQRNSLPELLKIKNCINQIAFEATTGWMRPKQVNM